MTNHKSQDVIEMIEDSSDDDVLVRTSSGENIVISDDEDDNMVLPLAHSSPRRTTGGRGGGGGGVGGGGGAGGGWGECPVCSQLMALHKLELHAMACQGLHLNGGAGLEVNPMEVQSRYCEPLLYWSIFFLI